MKIHNEILNTLDKIDRPTVVCTSGDKSMIMPGLLVDGVGEVRLPLGKSQAKQLIEHCQQAPYGKGTDTLVDTDVRRTWELDAQYLEFANPNWNDFIESLVVEVQEKLGLEDHKLIANPYKLLLYDKGGFFLPHRDGEKLDRMVATLVVALPSVYEGGELLVSHDGKQHKIVFDGAKGGFELSYAVFYADCQHEVKPVLSGCRLCLTYNLTLTKSGGKKGLTAPSWQMATKEMSELIGKWRNKPEEQKMAVLLDHRYTQEGLSVEMLKGLDRAKAEVLFDAAAEMNCMAHLALITFWQSGSALDDGDYSYNYRRNYDCYDDEDDEEKGEGEHEMDEVFDESLSANHWSDSKGYKVQFGELMLDESEIVAASPLLDSDPDNEEFEGYTGNAGMTLERWYHSAAVVIWPRSLHYRILCDAGTEAAIGGLKPLVEQLKHFGKVQSENQRRVCLGFAGEIIDSWQASDLGLLNGSNTDNRVEFVSLLRKLDDPNLTRRFLSKVMLVDGDIQLDKAFCRLFKKYGWENFTTELSSVIGASTAGVLNRNAELLALLCLEADKNTKRITLCHTLSDRAVKALQTYDKQPPESGWRIRTVDRSAMIGSLIKAMLGIHAEQPLENLIHHSLKLTRKYRLTKTHLAALFSIEARLAKSSSPSISYWLIQCRDELISRTTAAPTKPKDYQREAKLSCSCPDCQMLSSFLSDPAKRQGRFPLAKQRRQHLHNIIDGNHCDLTHETERVGRPYTLVCTKTTASYVAAKKIYQRDLGNLSRLVKLISRRQV